jgi:peptidoglycan/xylan/chitin deacetylase (PgdA/CDA1 family)
VKKQGKLLLIIGCAVIVIAAAVLGGYKMYRVHEVKKCGILLAFDDYNEQNWRDHFDLFEKYNVPVTFFVTLDEPNEFCHDAIKKGHEIGCHTIGHMKVTEMTDEEIQEKVIDPIEIFGKDGIEITSFAYPYGARTEELDELLLQHYKTVRGAYFYELHNKADLRHGFVDAYPLDNYYFESDEEFQKSIDAILDELCENEGAVTCMYSHAIDGGDWCVTEDHLEYLFQKAHERGLEFYTFQQWQNF